MPATKRSGARLSQPSRLIPRHVCLLRTAPRSGRHPFASVPSATGKYAADRPRLRSRDQHDGFRIVACRQGERVRLFTRNGYDFTTRFPKIAASLAALPVRSCMVDGEAIVVNREGLSVFDLLRFRRHDHAAVLCAFDLIELDGFDLRQQPLEYRKGILARLLHDAGDGIAFNKHFAGDGEAIFKHACALGCEGIVSKRLGSPAGSITG
jgi:hypothetical protein